MIGSKTEWNNKNELRNYPFLLNGVDIWQDIVIDMGILLYAESDGVFLDSVSVTERLVGVSFSDATTGESIFSAYCKRGDPCHRRIYSPSGVAEGSVMFGAATEVPIGLHRFQPGQVSVVPHCISDIGERAVNYISVNSLDERLQDSMGLRFSGDFTTHHNKRGEYLLGEVNSFHVSIGNVNGYVADCEPAKTVCECTPRPIRNINSVYPSNDANRNIILELRPLGRFIVVNEENSGSIKIGFEATKIDTCEQPVILPTLDGILPGEIDSYLTLLPPP